MEYGLGHPTRGGQPVPRLCLNPCFNGIWSRTFIEEKDTPRHFVVLILVLMEYGLGHDYDALHVAVGCTVLILVLMEYGLGQAMPDAMPQTELS